MSRPTRQTSLLWILIPIMAVFYALFAAQPSLAQTSQSLTNGSFEQEVDGHPTDWIFPDSLATAGIEITLDKNDPLDGEKSALVDSTNKNSSDTRAFGILNQRIDPASLRGKRIRFRAAVRTAERTEQGRAQLWLRVDRAKKGGKSVMGAFDNMQNRPITDDDWGHHEIVVDIDDDAELLTVGMLVLGKAKAWMDDASLELVEDDVATTNMTSSGVWSRRAPQQPFFNHWLWLVVIAISLMIFSQTKNSFVQRFALRFSIVYWLLYSLPSPLVGILGSVIRVLAKLKVPVESVSARLGQFMEGYSHYTEQAVHWTANHVVGIEGKLVLPNGSGDTTFAYIRLLICLTTAVAIALIWSVAFYRRKTDHVWLRDLLRSYLRYVLALTMLGYGLHKAGFIQTQFATAGVPADFQLSRTYGDSSPMGLLWTFMAASPMYTFFAGLGEVVGGILLVFRRTATLGALVVFGVMLNVVMLNFCYDVPVKQYSFHLLLMAVFLVLPAVPSLTNVLLLNRPTTKIELLGPPYANSISAIWIHRGVKTLIVCCAVGWPVFEHVKKEIQHEHPTRMESEYPLINRGYRWINEYPFNR